MRLFRCVRARLLGLVLVTAPVWAAAQAVGLPTLTPAAVRIGTATSVLVTVGVRQANVLPGGVNVLRVAPGGQATVLATLNDAGVNGDAVAGDGVYAGRVVLNEAIEGVVGLRASVAVRGSLRRLVSPDASLGVVPATAPVALVAPDPSLTTTDQASGALVSLTTVNACFSVATSYAGVVAAAAAAGAAPAGRFPAIGNCYQLALDVAAGRTVAAALTTLAARPEVISAEPEPIVSGFDVCSGPVCADTNYATVLRLPQAHNLGLGAANVVVGVLDTGLDAARIPTANFANVQLGSNFSSSGPAGIPRDDNGHGTLVTHIVQATAPGATVFVSKVLNAAKAGTEASSMLGMQEAVANGAQILNMSLGSRLQTFAMRSFLDAVQNAGVLIVAAAGNANSSIREYPAAHVGVVAVGNVDDHDQRHTGADGSNFGPWVNIAAPGVNVGGFGAAGTGTSFSAPFVAGTAALVRSKFTAMSRSDLMAQLYRTALPIPFIAGQDTCPIQPCNQDLGAGRLDPEAAQGAVRITRVTSVGAAGAAITRTIEVSLASAATNAEVLPTTFMAFRGQSTGCEVATVVNPTCIANVPFDFAALPAGNYVLRLAFRDPTASFFGSLQLNTPQARFTAVRSGTGSINAADPARADFSLFGFGVRTASFELQKP